MIEARDTPQYDPITVATTTVVKDSYKLQYYFGYDELGTDGERVELYDLKNDSDELNDLSSSKPETTSELLNELKQKITEVNEPYLK